MTFKTARLSGLFNRNFLRSMGLHANFSFGERAKGISSGIGAMSPLTPEIKNLDDLSAHLNVPVKTIRTLPMLHIKNANLQTLDFLKEMAMLKVLVISNSHVDDFSALGQLTSLNELKLVFVRSLKFETLKEAKNIEMLAIEDCGITDQEIKFLPDLPFLKVAMLERTAVTQAKIAAIKAQRKNLTVVG